MNVNYHCGSCLYFAVANDDPDAPVGTCHRYAPRPVTVSNPAATVDDIVADHTAVWPVVDDTDHCGEYSARPFPA